jgi:hypothetical protein
MDFFLFNSHPTCRKKSVLPNLQDRQYSEFDLPSAGGRGLQPQNGSRMDALVEKVGTQLQLEKCS